MGAQQSNSAAAAGVGLCGSQNQPPTTVEMSDGRVVSFDEYLQQSSDRYIPVKAPRKSRVGAWGSVFVIDTCSSHAPPQASAAHETVAAAKPLRGVAKQTPALAAPPQPPRDCKPQPKRSDVHVTRPDPTAAPPPAVAIDLSQCKLSKSAKKCIETVMAYDNVCCQFLRDGDGWIEQLPLHDHALTADVRLPPLRMGKFVLTHARPIGQGTSGTVLRGWMAGRAVALKLQYEKCPGLNHDMCRNAYSQIWTHLAPDAGLGDWFGFCIGRVPWSRETVYISLMQFYEHLLDKVMDGSDRRRTVADCGGAAHLAARVGLAMLPVMDSIHVQRKAYTDMKPQNIALDAGGRPFLIDVGQLANQGSTGGKLGTQFWQPLRKQAGNAARVRVAVSVYRLCDCWLTRCEQSLLVRACTAAMTLSLYCGLWPTLCGAAATAYGIK